MHAITRNTAYTTSTRKLLPGLVEHPLLLLLCVPRPMTLVTLGVELCCVQG